MTDAKYSFEYPDEAGYPDGTGFLSEDQKTLIDQVDHPSTSESNIPFVVVDDVAASSYRAISGDTMVGEITYRRHGSRVTLVATTVPEEFTHQGVATELIRRVLTLIRDEKMTLTIVCPIVRTFINRNPEFESIVDVEHPGAQDIEQ